LLAAALVVFPELLEAQAVVVAQPSPAAEAAAPGLPPEVKFMLSTIGSGGIAGWAVGFTLKKFAKLLALVIGIAFMSLQLLAFNRFITIDWERIKKAVPDESIEQSATSLMSVITYNLPFAGSFAAGFWLGFRKG
jgi:uncharacterized membrane protein (Fun14 family)